MKDLTTWQVLQVSQDSRSQWESLKEYIGKRAKIEGRYGAEMIRLAEEIASPGSHKLLEELSNSTLNQGNSHSIFSSQLEKDLIQTMKNFEAGYLVEMRQHEEAAQKAEKAEKDKGEKEKGEKGEKMEKAEKAIGQLQPLVEKIFALYGNILLALSTYSIEAVGPIMQSEELARKTYEDFGFQQYLVDFLANLPAHQQSEKIDMKKKARTMGDLPDSASAPTSRKEKEVEDREAPDSPTPKSKKRQSFFGGILKKADGLHDEKKGKKEVRASKTTEDLPSERPVSFTPPIESSMSADFELDADGFRVRKKESAHPFENVGGLNSDSDEEDMPKPKKLEIVIKETPTGNSHSQETEIDPEAILESLQKLQHGEQKFRMPLQPSASSRKDRRKSGYLLATPDSMSPRTESPLSAQGEAPPFQPSPIPSPSTNSAHHNLDDAFGGPVMASSHTLPPPVSLPPPHSPRAQPPPDQYHPQAQAYVEPGTTVVDFGHSTPAEPIRHRPLRVTMTTLDEAFGGTLTPEPTQHDQEHQQHQQHHQQEYQQQPLEEPQIDPASYPSHSSSLSPHPQSQGEDQPQDLVMIPSTNPFLLPSFQILQREGSVSLNVHATNPFLPEILASAGDLSRPIGIEADHVPMDEPQPHHHVDEIKMSEDEITVANPQNAEPQLDVTLSPIPSSAHQALHSRKSIAEAFGEEMGSFHQTPEKRPFPQIQSEFLSGGSKDIDSPVWALEAAMVTVDVREVTQEDFEFDEASSPLSLDKSLEFSFEKVKESQQSLEVPVSPRAASESPSEEKEKNKETEKDKDKGDEVGGEREGRHSRFQSIDSSPNEQEEEEGVPEVAKKSRRSSKEEAQKGGDKGSKKSSKSPKKKDKKAEAPSATLAPPSSATSTLSTLPESSAEENNRNPPKSPSKSPKPPKKRSSKQDEDSLKSTENLAEEPQKAPKSPKKKRLSGGKSAGGEPPESAVAEPGSLKDFNDILAAAFD